MLEPGSKIGHFIIEEKIGSGAAGTVYRAHSAEGHKTVALKVIAPGRFNAQKAVVLFEEEAAVGLQLAHPNIVQTLYVGHDNGVPYLVFEFVQGVPLDRILDDGPLPQPHCLWILKQMAQALRHLYQKHIIHQDIKPGNILIDLKGNAKLTDLGLARLPRGKMQWEGVAAGTALYMPPEQARGLASVDCRADIYSLGATIYHAATGAPPFFALDEKELMRMHIIKRPDSAFDRNRNLQPVFASVLNSMLEKDPRWRYQTPEELLLAMRALDLPEHSPFVTAPLAKQR